jgi:hypothetical protein
MVIWHRRSYERPSRLCRRFVGRTIKRPRSPVETVVEDVRVTAAIMGSSSLMAATE